MDEPVKQTPRNLPPGPGPGRPKGLPNRTTGLLKEAILKAAELAGDDAQAEHGGEGGLVGYLDDLRRNEPKAFATLVGKVLPMQIQGDFDVGAKDSLRDLMESINGRTRTKP